MGLPNIDKKSPKRLMAIVVTASSFQKGLGTFISDVVDEIILFMGTI